MSTLKDLVGQRFGRLTVLKRAPNKPSCGHAIWECLCDCGAVHFVASNNLKNRAVTSCGCFQREESKKRLLAIIRFTHGHTRGGKNTPEYRSWAAMLTRCTNPNQKAYINYGGRGITVCERWRNSYEAFFADMGAKPTPGHTLDRIDCNGHYEPSNCRWATRLEQAQNTRRSFLITINNRTQTLAAWARESNNNAVTIFDRLKRGVTGEALLIRRGRDWRAVREANP